MSNRMEARRRFDPARWTVRWAAAVLLTTGASVTWAATFGENLLSTGWFGNDCSGWTFSQSSVGCASQVYHWEPSALRINLSATGNRSAHSEDVPAVANKSYKLSYFVRTNDVVGPGCYGVLQFRDESGNSLSWDRPPQGDWVSGTTTSGTNYFVLKSITATSPPTTASVRVFLLCEESGATEGGIGRFDDVYVEKNHNYNPGHYVSMNKTDSQSDIATMLAIDGVQGVQIRYQWKDLETSQNQYNFSPISNDLAYVAAHGGKLVAIIEDKSFSTTSPAPAYVPVITGTNGVSEAPLPVTVVHRWDPYFADRYAKLLEEAAAALRNHPDANALEGLAMQESSLVSEGNLLLNQGYDVDDYLTALQNVMSRATAALDYAQFFWYFNFIPGDNDYTGHEARLRLSEVAETARNVGATLSGPDLLPEKSGLLQYNVPLYDASMDRVPLQISIQNNSYSYAWQENQESPPYDMWSLFSDGLNLYHMNYLMWNNKHWGTETYHFDPDAEDVITNNEQFNAWDMSPYP